MHGLGAALTLFLGEKGVLALLIVMLLVVGMLLDLAFAQLQKAVTYVE